MADTIDDAEYEQKFTRENTWRNFKMAAFGAISAATFFGLLGTIANRLIAASEAFSPKALEAAAKAGSAAPSSFFEAFVGNPMLTIPLMVGMAVVGVTAAYASVSEGTEIKKLQDNRLARQNAKAQQVCKEQGVCNDVEYPQNQRADGKAWTSAITQEPAQVAR